MGVLTVVLLRITDLVDDDLIGKSDPYVTFEVEKDGFFSDKTMGTAQSTKKKDEVNPIYNETFNFTLPDLKDMELKIKVMDDDVGLDEKLGGAVVHLSNLHLEDGPVHEHMIKVDSHLFSKDAKMYLNLSWHP